MALLTLSFDRLQEERTAKSGVELCENRRRQVQPQTGERGSASDKVANRLRAAIPSAALSGTQSRRALVPLDLERLMHNARSTTHGRSMRVIISPLDCSQRGQIQLASPNSDPLLSEDMLAYGIQIDVTTVRQHNGTIAKAGGALAIIIG